MDRRGFLKAGAAFLGAAATAGIPADNSHALDRRKAVATLIDLTKCDGCDGEEVPICVKACRTENADRFPEPVKPIPDVFPTHKIADWSDRRDVIDRLTPYNWIFVQKVKVGSRTVHIPRRCMHCDNPPCANLCPWGVNKKMPEGPVVINTKTCLGGAKCKSVCPWHIPQRQSGVGLYLKILPNFIGNGVMYKCDLCYHRTKEGKPPACVEACPKGAMVFGPRDEIIAMAKRPQKEIGGYLYGLDENGGTSTIYVSDVPFEEIDRRIKPRDGYPHMKRVKPFFEKFTKAAGYLGLIPLASAATALGMVFAKKSGSKDQGGK